jgi:lipopolysaccharide biosynthesis regulator YciM
MDTMLFNLGGHPVTWLHLAVAAAFLAAGLIAGWLLVKLFGGVPTGPPQKSVQPQKAQSHDAFVKGVTHMMADHTDQAIEEFTRAVTLNSDTVETYVVLGNLFRQKGEIERAVRIRQNIIARPNLNNQIKLQALFALGLDYKKGGLLNRAADAFEQVLGLEAKHVEALRQMVALYEEMHEWDNAFDSLKRLDKLTGEDSRKVLAHYRTERGKELMRQGHLERAEDSFGQAINVHKGCLDAYLHMGDLQLARGRNKKALNVWRKAVQLSPLLVHLVIARLAEAEEKLGKDVVDGFYGEVKLAEADITTLLCMARYFHRHQEDEKAFRLAEKAVAMNPAHMRAQKLLGELLIQRGDQYEAVQAYRKLLNQLGGDAAAYQCRQCGQFSHELSWKCPRCNLWDTMEPRVPVGTEPA